MSGFRFASTFRRVYRMRLFRFFQYILPSSPACFFSISSTEKRALLVVCAWFRFITGYRSRMRGCFGSSLRKPSTISVIILFRLLFSSARRSLSMLSGNTEYYIRSGPIRFSKAKALPSLCHVLIDMAAIRANTHIKRRAYGVHQKLPHQSYQHLPSPVKDVVSRLRRMTSRPTVLVFSLICWRWPVRDSI